MILKSKLPSICERCRLVNDNDLFFYYEEKNNQIVINVDCKHRKYCSNAVIITNSTQAREYIKEKLDSHNQDEFREVFNAIKEGETA